MFLPFIYLQATSTEGWLNTVVLSAIVGGVLGILGGYLTYLYNKPIQVAGIKHTNTETVVLTGDTLIKWIEKFEAAKSEALELEEEVYDLRKELNNCNDATGDCKETLISTKAMLESVSAKLSTLLTDLDDKDGVLTTLTGLKEALEKKINLPKS